MLLTIINNLFYVGIMSTLLILIPALLTIIGGFLDYNNRSQGNLKNDLPSTILFILGIMIDIYLMYKFNLIVIFTSILFLFSIYFFVKNEDVRFARIIIFSILILFALINA